MPESQEAGKALGCREGTASPEARSDLRLVRGNPFPSVRDSSNRRFRRFSRPWSTGPSAGIPGFRAAAQSRRLLRVFATCFVRRRDAWRGATPRHARAAVRLYSFCRPLWRGWTVSQGARTAHVSAAKRRAVAHRPAQLRPLRSDDRWSTRHARPRGTDVACSLFGALFTSHL